MKIVSWQYSMSTHQFYMWKALKSLSGEELLFVLENSRDVQTKEVSLDELNGLGRIIYTGGFRWRDILPILQQNLDAVHVFGGFRNGWYFFPLILYAIMHNVKVAVMNEPYSIYHAGYAQEEAGWWMRLKVSTRPLLYRLTAILIKIFVKKFQPCILPISLLAREQFMQAAFDPDAMYPFGYFVPRQSVKGVKPAGSRNGLRLVFVGSLLKTKGLDIAVEAIEKVHSDGFDISMDVFGFGPTDWFLPAASTCIHYKGSLLPYEVQSVMAQYDLLILPSRHDGWGVVVNEALLQGVPVIVSDRVGAKCLIESSGAGLIFKSENTEELTLKLKELILQPSLFEEMSRKAESVGNDISPEIGARYLLDVFHYHFYNESQRPSGLWTNPNSNDN